MSKLKTVWDAVNELRGEWIFECKELWEEKINYIITFESKLTPSAYSFHDNLISVNYKEFNALVVAMSLGLDVNQVSKRRLEEYIDADKQELEPVPVIDWDSAPEDATHYCPSNKQFSEVFIKDLTDDGYSYKVVGGSYVDNEWEYTSPIVKGELHGIVKRPAKQQLNIYTQEMYDNGELPSVGMKCIAESNGVVGGSYLVTVSQINDKGQFACIDENGDYLVHYPDEDKSESFKPIDTRTKKEKAIDEFMAKNLKGGIAFKHLISKAYDEWVGE